ncbi:MAG: TolC family protein, partial [Bryobacteraceae bacterium]
IASGRVQVARDPFLPKIFAGSGAAYTSGFPMSIEGSAPAIVQARAVASVYDRRQRLQLEAARENVRGAGLDTERRRDRVVRETIEAWLEAYWTARSLDLATRQTGSLEKARDVVRLRVEAGRDTPIELRRAELEVARARQRAEAVEGALAYAEETLAMIIGLPAGDRARAAEEEPAAIELPAGEEAAVAAALESSREVRRLESALAAKGLEAESHRSARWPRLSLVAQYGLFSRFNNYDEFFQRFQRHNGQIGVALEVPVWIGAAPAAQASQAESEAQRLRTEIAAARQRISLETRQAFREVRRAATGRDVARLDLDVARESLSVVLALMDEGRATLRQLEEARAHEQSKWIAYYDAQHAFDRARYSLLDNTGALLASLR